MDLGVSCQQRHRRTSDRSNREQKKISCGTESLLDQTKTRPSHVDKLHRKIRQRAGHTHAGHSASISRGQQRQKTEYGMGNTAPGGATWLTAAGKPETATHRI
jgi:hypothetical protein